MTLYINACPREGSRTDRLAKALLKKLGDYTELKLNTMDLRPLDNERLERRTSLISKGDYSDPIFYLAKQFADADQIVIAAPYWDGSFPAILKIYIENIYVTGIVSRFNEEGIPVGMCKADKLYYVTTAGGKYIPDFSYGYLSALATGTLGIQKTELIFSEFMDIFGNDPEAILQKAINGINNLREN